MNDLKRIKSALISVYDKSDLEPIIQKLNELNVTIYSTGGTQKFIEKLGVPVTPVESLTEYPSILGGRVKTLHPKVFGGILARRDNTLDKKELDEYNIPTIDLVIVNLYPFEQTVTSGASEQEIIEKIDIGGIALIRATAKNFKDTLIVPSKNQYQHLLSLLEKSNGESTIRERKAFALQAFNVSSHYDTAIFNYFNQDFNSPAFKQSITSFSELRYGENPHQKGFFFGNLDEIFEQLHGKQISYNNLLDIEAAVQLMSEFEETTFAILKHNNACGIASRNNLRDAWKDALAGDPVSAFGGILITNTEVDKTTAEEINKIFFEVIIAPSYHKDALETLKQKKNRIILIQKSNILPKVQFRSMLNGALLQDKDLKIEHKNDLDLVTKKSPSEKEVEDLLFANKVVKHSKSNTIVLAKNKQLCASGVGQTSRVDALKQAIEKAENFKFDLNGAVMASDAFFPFADSVEIAHSAGITSVIQPGGSVRDQESINFCNKHNLSMVFTGTRHFKH
ncbi:MAG: bifunctional phosphoribosylaminoimidazolecarboxamide formyltransferase/IMP cyclohydrolase [Bacteroidota bacterium]|nr:bifunctional phosphoribosylaminoimidazolecarboxamide formyltransferase/IMP cyclohydrolase [Bacteroidota bacterium]